MERYGRVRADLASSGIPAVSSDVLGPVALDDLDAPRDFADAIAERYGVGVDEVVPALGTSQALHVACAAILEPGDDVLVETPTYEPLHRVPIGLGARVRTFTRSHARGYAIDVAEIRAHLTERTRMVLVTSPHNPSGIPIPRAQLEELARTCADVGAALLVDEVYAEFANGRPESARAAGQNVVAVSSLTKRWGLGWARAGWMIASPEIAGRAQIAIRHSVGHPGTAHAALGLAALRALPALTERADAILEGGADVVNDWIESRDRSSWKRPPAGPFGFVRVEGAEDLRPAIDRLCTEHGVIVAPGSFFGAPGAFRIGWTCAKDVLEYGLSKLDELFS